MPTPARGAPPQNWQAGARLLGRGVQAYVACGGLRQNLDNLAYDALEESFRVFKVNRDPECPACGENAGEIVIAEYDELCMPHPRQAPATA